MKTTPFIGMLFLVLGFALGSNLSAQDKKERTSPPRSSTAVVGGTEVTVTYSAPSKKDRTVFGELVPYGKVWRTGANEASTISLNNDVKVGGTPVKAGKYALLTIPGEDSWEIILNEVWDQWGAYNYDESKDVVRFTARTNQLKEPVEEFTIEVNNEGRVAIRWDMTAVYFDIK